MRVVVDPRRRSGRSAPRRDATQAAGGAPPPTCPIPSGSMAVGRVHWGSYDGDELEHAMALLLFQERPNGWRRATSQGDGGIDFLDPLPEGYEVFQIKGFTDRAELKAGQRRQIKDSYETVRSDPRLDRPIVRWNLVVPIDPNDKDEEWFRELTKDAPFECRWLGEVFWNDQAARYPRVIDFFFADGKQRLAERVKTLHGLLSDPDSPPRPGDVVGALLRLQGELDDNDPHYRYEFALTKEPPPPRPRPGLVMTATRGTEDGRFVTVDVFARFAQAIDDRPIGGSLTITVLDPNRGIDLREAYRAFVEYGRRLHIPDGALERFELDAPGALGGEFGGGQAVLGPRSVPITELHRLELAVSDPAGAVIAAATVPVADITIGEKGIEYTGTDTTACFDFQIQIDRTPDAAGNLASVWGLRQRDLVGLPAVTALPALRLMHAVHAPNLLRADLYRGEHRVFQALRILDDPEAAMDDLSMTFAEHLARLQPHTPVLIPLPPTVSADTLTEVRRAVDLLEGKTVTLGPVTVALEVPPESAAPIEERVGAKESVEATVPLSIDIGDVAVPLGTIHAVFTDPRVDKIEDRGDAVNMWITADSAEETLISMLVGPPHT